jgi:hypothetical protein
LLAAHGVGKERDIPDQGRAIALHRGELFAIVREGQRPNVRLMAFQVADLAAADYVLKADARLVRHFVGEFLW